MRYEVRHLHHGFFLTVLVKLVKAPVPETGWVAAKLRIALARCYLKQTYFQL